MPGNNGRRASANANTLIRRRRAVADADAAGASLSSSSMVTATGPPSSSSLSFLELRHLRRSAQRCGLRAPARRGGEAPRRALVACGLADQSGGEAHSTTSYRPKAAYE